MQCQMPPGRKTSDPDSLGIDVPFFRLAANEADGPMRIFERGIDVIVAIFQNDPGDAAFLQRQRYLVTFFFNVRFLWLSDTGNPKR